MLSKFHCSFCNTDKEYESSITTGYATTKEGKKACYTCCAKEDLRVMRETGRIILYLVHDEKRGDLVTNWPMSLSFKVKFRTKGLHNIARVRHDVWFYVDGKEWHGTQYGEMTQLCHCRRKKES